MPEKHDVTTIPRMNLGGRGVDYWYAACNTCLLDGPHRQHRALAAHDADRHRPHGDPFPEAKPGRW